MKFTIAFVASLVAFTNASVISRQASCSEAARFGNLSVSNINGGALNAGDSFTITDDFTCALQKGINPKTIDYVIEVLVNNNGHEAPYLLARKDFDSNAPVQTFTATVPHGYYFKGASYVLTARPVYDIQGSDGSAVTTIGGTQTASLPIVGTL